MKNQNIMFEITVKTYLMSFLCFLVLDIYLYKDMSILLKIYMFIFSIIYIISLISYYLILERISYETYETTVVILVIIFFICGCFEFINIELESFKIVTLIFMIISYPLINNWLILKIIKFYDIDKM